MTSRSERIARDVRAELRSILRQIEDLGKPLDQFLTDPGRPIGSPRHFVQFDTHPRKSITGLRCQVVSLDLYDERILKAVEVLAQTVWHLKDPLHQWAKMNKSVVNVDEEARKSAEMMLVGDLANLSKHKRSDNRSGQNPRVEVVKFDRSKSGVVEFYYDGARKEKELLVTFMHPIAYTVDLVGDPYGAVIGEALTIIQDAFRHWLPIIEKLGVLSPDDPESRSLRERLFPP
jgi:hypothetical protein